MKEYDSLIDSFSELHIKDKRHEVMYELQELMALFQTLNLKNGTNPNVLLHHAMNDYKEEHDENDFLNAIYSTLISTKELVGKYLDK